MSVYPKANLEDYRGAIDDFSKAIELNPNDGGAYYNRGLAKEALEDYRGAIHDIKKGNRKIRFIFASKLTKYSKILYLKRRNEHKYYKSFIKCLIN